MILVFFWAYIFAVVVGIGLCVWFGIRELRK